MSNPISGLKGAKLCRSAAETWELGKMLGIAAVPGLVIALEGPLGAGKTEFVRGVAAGLGCPGEVSSPTFTIAHEYPGGRLALHHFDFYRMQTEDEVLTSGFEERLGGEGVVAVEWAGKFASCLPRDAVWVRLRILAGDAREVSIA